eukprot:782736-Rhodomonas_salina.1
MNRNRGRIPTPEGQNVSWEENKWRIDDKNKTLEERTAIVHVKSTATNKGRRPRPDLGASWDNQYAPLFPLKQTLDPRLEYLSASLSQHPINSKYQ